MLELNFRIRIELTAPSCSKFVQIITLLHLNSKEHLLASVRLRSECGPGSIHGREGAEINN